MVALPTLHFPRVTAIASAAALTVPKADCVIPISGTTTITSITTGGTGQVIHLEFASAACQVTSGSNLKLVGNYVSTVLGTLTLECDGTNWIEVARSPLGIAGLPTNPEVEVFHNANQSVLNNTWTILAFNTESLDTGALHDTATNNSRLIATTAGRYLVWGTVNWAANAAGDRHLLLTKNSGGTPAGGTSQMYNVVASASGVDVTGESVCREVALALNDYLELHVLQSSGGALNVNSFADSTPKFGMRWLGA